MTVRAMWKGTLRIADEALPFKLFAAASDRDLHFRLLHAADREPVQQRMAHPVTGETVAAEDVRRGVEVERGRFVVVQADELDALTPEPSRDVVVTHCVEAARIDHRWYDRPYFLGPDEGQVERYFALAKALERSGLEGITAWTMRNRRYAGALLVRDGHLALVTLRSADAVIDLAALSPPAGRALDDRERALAAQLVEALTGPFDPAQFPDEYRERVMNLVEAKRNGRRPRLARFEPEPEPDEASLADVLERSLERSLDRSG